MKYKFLITSMLIILCTITLAACVGKASRSGGELVDNVDNSLSTTAGKNEPLYDLKNPTELKKFVEYLDLDKALLVEGLAQEFGESPAEETDPDTGATLLKLEKTGLIFHLTDEEGIPVSHVDILDGSPFHYGGARGNMSFPDIMNLVGETMITSDPYSEGEEQKEYRITYPLEGVSVAFTSKHIFENSSKMVVYSWGYYDEEPTLLSAKEIYTAHGKFSIPASWVGKIALADSGTYQIVSYLSPHGSYSLIEMESFNLSEWDELNPAEQNNYQIISKTEDWVFGAKRLSEHPNNKEDAKRYQSMQSEIDDMLNSFKSSYQISGSYNSASDLCNDEYISQITRPGQVSQIFEEFFLENWKDPSETGMDEAYSEFGKCFAEKIDNVVSGNKSLESTVSQLRTHIPKINNDWYEYQSYLNGGGTMWSHMSIRQASMIDAVIYGFLLQVNTSEGQTENKDEFNKMMDLLNQNREYTSQNSGEAMNPEDQGNLEETTERLISSYDGLISVLEKIDPNQAGVELLQFTTNYQVEGLY